MATAVEEAIEEKRHLIVEAGTGTGKTLAYLLPIIKSGKRVIVSTGTKNLQEQLFIKDVPFLERALFGDNPSEDQHLRVCYMKGRQNYLCRKKLYDLTGQPILNGLDEINEFRTLLDWDKETKTGDRAELSTASRDQLRSGVSSTPAPSIVSAASVRSSSAASSPRCAAKPPRATSSSSTTISSSPTSRSSSPQRKHLTPVSCPQPPASSSTKPTSLRTLPPATSASLSQISR